MGRVEEDLNLLTAGVSVLVDGHRSKLQVNYLWDLRADYGHDEIRVQYQVEF